MAAHSRRILVNDLRDGFRTAFWVSSLFPDAVAAHDYFLRPAIHPARSSLNDLLLHGLRRAKGGIPIHKSDAARVGTDVNWREVRIGGDHFDMPHRATQHLGGDLRDHRVRSLANIRRARVNHHAAIAINLDVYGGVRHIRANN